MTYLFRVNFLAKIERGREGVGEGEGGRGECESGWGWDQVRVRSGEGLNEGGMKGEGFNNWLNENVT